MLKLKLNQLTELLQSSQNLNRHKYTISQRKIYSSLAIMTIDTIVLSFAFLASIFLRDLITGTQSLFSSNFYIFSLFIPLLLTSFGIRRLYPGFGEDAISELRNITFTITSVFAIVAVFTLFSQDIWNHSRLIFLFYWVFSLVLIPVGRAFVRKAISNKEWWGIPVIIIGAGNTGGNVIKILSKNHNLGLKPVVAIDDDLERWGYIEDVPVVGGLEIIPELAKKLDLTNAIFAIPKVPGNRQKEILEKYSKYFQHSTIIPDLYGISTLWVSPRDFGGIFGLEVQLNLTKKSSFLFKRMFDITCAIILGTLLLPIIGIISLMIYLDSRGNVFFRQERMGLGNEHFEIVKFRTMHLDAEKRLNELLQIHPELKAEYDIYHKLKNDPRLTKVGKFLRKYSLDELPQFYNVLKGEMSLIGPRAYMPWERVKMTGNDELILQVKPGISGLWQVNDRHNSTFEDRNATDVHYIRNWSLFLDFYIFGKTIAVILNGKGE